MNALETARGGLVAAQAARRTAEQLAESERCRLESLKAEAAGVEGRLGASAREAERREARAEAAAAAADREEARLADCRDSFGLEVEGLQRGVGELESEAVGWREALEQARTRLASEEERGRADKLRLEAETARLGEMVEGLGAEAREWEARLGALRRRHQSDEEKLARESRQGLVELHELKSKVAEARSSLEAGRAELHTVAAVVEEKAAAIEKADAVAASLERRAAEAGAQVKDLEAARERASREGEVARRQQAEELSRWKEAMAERRREFEGISKLVVAKAASLGDLERQVRR